MAPKTLLSSCFHSCFAAEKAWERGSVGGAGSQFLNSDMVDSQQVSLGKCQARIRRHVSGVEGESFGQQAFLWESASAMNCDVGSHRFRLGTL